MLTEWSPPSAIGKVSGVQVAQLLIRSGAGTQNLVEEDQALILKFVVGLGNRHRHVAEVADLVAEGPQGRRQMRVSEGRRAHVHPAPSRAQIHWNAQNRNIHALSLSLKAAYALSLHEYR